MHSFEKWKTLARLNAVSYTPYLVAFLVGVSIADTWGLWLLPAVFSLLLFTATGYALNWYVDALSGVDVIAKDKDTRLRANPFLTGEVSFIECLFFVLATTFFGITLFYLAFMMIMSVIFFASCLIAVILSVICYNLFYWKAKPGLDILCIPIGSGALLVLAGMHELSFEPVIYALLTIPLYLESEIWDIEADKKCGLKTTAVVLGEKKARLCCYSLYGLCLVSSIAFIPHNPLFFAVMAIAAVVNLTPVDAMKRFKSTLVLIILFILLSVLIP